MATPDGFYFTVFVLSVFSCQPLSNVILRLDVVPLKCDVMFNKQDQLQRGEVCLYNISNNYVKCRWNKVCFSFTFWAQLWVQSGNINKCCVPYYFFHSSIVWWYDKYSMLDCLILWFNNFSVAFFQERTYWGYLQYYYLFNLKKHLNIWDQYLWRSQIFIDWLLVVFSTRITWMSPNMVLIID